MQVALTRLFGCLAILVVMAQVNADDQSRTLDAKLHHLRNDGPREWEEFPESPEADRLEVTFDADVNKTEWTLRLRQQDVKQGWLVRLNDAELGQLRHDENDMVVYFAVSSGTLLASENKLVIEQNSGDSATPDDIRVGEAILLARPVHDVLSTSRLQITVIDADTNQPLPARVTILNDNGALQSVEVAPDPRLAVRPGTIFTATGQVEVSFPEGTYTVHAGHGFEYSLDSTEVTVRAGETVPRTLTIRREVPTDGYVACDTHVHSLTHSGHGDATVLERMVTIAAEGIELPVATDHNVQINHEPFAREVGVRKYFTPVIGNEVTTPVGHFNIFPVSPDAAVPNHRATDWGAIFAEIDRATGAPVIVLNHARDLHSGVRPFGPKHFNSSVAASVDGWPAGFNAMEVINSGATQTDTMQLFRDWMALLNRGISVTPIGASDSHDVGRHFVGQGRTYIRCDDSDPGDIDLSDAVESLRQGRVMVSYGLLAEINVNGHGSGEVVAVEGDTVRVDVKVLGPHWVEADRVELFANGRMIREHAIPDQESGDALADAERLGIKWVGHWDLPRPKHDVHLVAIARGPGVDGSFWKTAKPYQPTSPVWRAQVIGCSGAVWLDVDGDGRRTPAREYATRVFDAADDNLPALLNSLADYDSAVAAHAANLHHDAGGSLTDESFLAAPRDAEPVVRDGFHSYRDAWRDTETARANATE